jgi:hypothetical protein
MPIISIINFFTFISIIIIIFKSCFHYIYFSNTEAQDIVQNYSFAKRIQSMTNV